jgi:rubrerythrin
MKTTQEWWNEVSNDENKFIHWLKSQYHGEVTAEKRILDSVQTYKLSGLERKVIESIAEDEKRHAVWVKSLLEKRGIKAEILIKEERYWSKTIPNVFEKNTFSYFCAVASLAETMRLERINLLANDERFKDVAEVFMKIFPDEIFHARMFKEMSTKEDMEEAEQFHNIGMNAIGLVA